MIAMFRLAFENAGQAFAAGAPAAEVCRLEAGFLDGFEKRLVFAHGDFRARSFEDGDERRAAHMRAAERFGVEFRGGPTMRARRIEHEVHQSFGTAGIKMRSERLRAQDGREIELRSGMDVYARRFVIAQKMAEDLGLLGAAEMVQLVASRLALERGEIG